MKYSIGREVEPYIVARCRLPRWPGCTPESTAVIDCNGNLYFGCHDGVFYSLDASLRVRWSYGTSRKIYGSPLLVDDRVVVASGDGNIYCFSLDGELIWRECFSSEEYGSKICRLFKASCSPWLSLLSRGVYFNDVGVVRSWCSVNLDRRGRLYVTGSGVGVHAFDLHSGELLYNFKLSGAKRHHLAGVTIDSEDRVYCNAQRRYLHCLVNGEAEWELDSHLGGYDSWGAPSYDEERQFIYSTWTLGQKHGVIVCVDDSGKEVWRRRFDGGIRGTPVHCGVDKLAVCSFNGELFTMSRDTGEVLWRKPLSSAPRACWSSPSVDSNGNILVSVKTSFEGGAIFAIDKEGELLWRHDTGKVLSTPVLDQNSRLYYGSYGGYYTCLQT